MPKIRNNKTVHPVPEEKQTQGYWKTLNTVMDPELDVGIVDLGLIYDVSIDKGVATVTMTLTSVGCPAGPELMEEAKKALLTYQGVKEVIVNLVWEPIWGPDRVHEAIRDLLFGID